MKYISILFIAFGLVGSASAEAVDSHPPISFVIPGNTTSSSERPVVVIVEGDFITLDNRTIPLDQIVDTVNSALKAEGAKNVGVHIRQGIKFGEVVKVLDEIRKTNAKAIGVSMQELSAGKTL